MTCSGLAEPGLLSKMDGGIVSKRALMAMGVEPIKLKLPRKFQPLFYKRRYKVFHGGRGSAKSHSVARALVARARSGKELILCTRELQASIKDSVHRVIKAVIYDMLGDTQDEFDILTDGIRHKRTGSEFIFKGLRHNAHEIKSLEGVTICWCEEADSISADSWQLLDPTIREPGSEIWITFNPHLDEDPIYQMFVAHQPPPNSVVVEVNYTDNPWFRGTELEAQRMHAWRLANETGDWDAYNWIWLGKCRKISDALVFRKRVSITQFETPTHWENTEPVVFHHGADWGFANDPSVLLRCFMSQDQTELYIDREAYGYQTEINDLPALFDTIETARQWTIRADCARPETISYMRGQGFNIVPAEKWSGSVEDGIAHLKGFRRIYIHETNCPRISEEARLYSYKVEKKTGKVLPKLVDAWNHGWDSARYALGDFIQRRGALGVWSKLAAAE
jgi:phage terminase large subunit